jgi:hypothetical protein
MPDAAAPPDFVPSAQIDITVPSVARVYDAFLYGKDNYEVDRAVLAQVMKVAPETPRMTRANRDWLIRVTRFLTSTAGIDQFLDVGAGLPTAENTHQAAQRVNPDARVIYVDHDPIVLAHGRALLEENALTHLVAGDLTKPDALFADPTVVRYLDFDRPIALIQCGTLHHVADDQRPHEIMQRYIELLPPGSYVALTHFCDPQDDGPGSRLARFLEEVFARGAMGSGYFRTRAEIEALFTGLELVPPGVARLRDWWPDGPHLQPPTAPDEAILGGVARKP